MLTISLSTLENQLPPGFGSLPLEIVRQLVNNTCIASRGQIDSANPNRALSSDCPICLEALEEELCLTHQSHGRTAASSTQLSNPCGCTYHLNCLVKWTKDRFMQHRSIRCPIDRSMLISYDDAYQMMRDFQVGAIPLHHTIRAIGNIVPWWNDVEQNRPQSSVCTFDIASMHPEAALGFAALGHDVGFIQADVIDALPLDPRVRRTFKKHMRQTSRHKQQAWYNRLRREKTYQTWIYVEVRRELYDDHLGIELVKVQFVPVKAHAGLTFRRYLLGLMGEACFIRWEHQEDRRFIKPLIARLDDSEVINLHAEMQIRDILRRRRRLLRPRHTIPWFWPFPNEGGGIVVGGTLPDTEHPARGYQLVGLDVGRSNDDRYARLVADTADEDSPVRNAKQLNDELVDQFLQVKLPSGFPQSNGLLGSAYFIPTTTQQQEAPASPTGITFSNRGYWTRRPFSRASRFSGFLGVSAVARNTSSQTYHSGPTALSDRLQGRRGTEDSQGSQISM